MDSIISLRIRHPTQDLAVVCGKLSMTPTRVWKAGEPRTTPKGEPLGGVRRESYCSIELGRVGASALAEGVRAGVVQLSKHRTLLDDVVASGGKLSLSVGWFLEGSSGESFDWELLKDLGQLRISLDLYLYPKTGMEEIDLGDEQ